ncbi:hypothetical protein J6TS2_51720 [Heyndrickxia sporothermodurans]|nr:hypothetical protein J6TS2_51720 [Heyndrickxia sporothermodurans]
MGQLLLDKKMKELSEYKSIYMIKNYFLLYCEGLQKDMDIHELLKVLLQLFYLLEKNGQKSHRYEKKTVFDILGVVYDCTLA